MYGVLFILPAFVVLLVKEVAWSLKYDELKKKYDALLAKSEKANYHVP